MSLSSSREAPRQLRPYQITGRDFLASRRAGLLAADPGLGKTAMATRALLMAGAHRILVLCPAVARAAWDIEAPLWGWPGRVVALSAVSQLDDGPGIFILSYTQITRTAWRKALRKTARFDGLVADEAHKLKERSAMATKIVYGRYCRGDGLVSRAERCWLLSGTPAPNNYGEVWSHLRALAPERIHNANGVPMDYPEFQEKVCVTVEGGYGSLRIVGSRNAAWLRERMSGFMLRQRKRDVAPDMPPLSFVDVDLSVDPQAVLDALVRQDAPLPIANRIEDDEQFLAAAQADPHVATLRRVLGVVKAPAAAEWIADQLDSGMPKVLVFALHREVLDILHGALAHYGVVRIDGSTSPHARAEAAAVFQGPSPKGPRVFLGQTLAAGTAITLTAASDVVMVEMSWTPSDNYQAACRAHRLGQRDGVLVRVLSAPNTFDQRVSRVLRRKSADIAALLDT